MFRQTFSPSDLATVAALVLLEGLLSIDNALVMGLLAQRVDASRRNAALFYGLVGAFVMRVLMIAMAAYLMRFDSIQVIGGIYLLWVGAKHLYQGRSGKAPSHDSDSASSRRFWSTVLAIELTDLSFAVDSILAAVALIGPAPEGTPVGAVHPKLWVVVTGGMLGVVLMRFAAAIFMTLLSRFPRLDHSAYLLVIVIGVKLIVDWGFDVDFLDPAGGAFWVFWLTTAACLAWGLIPRKPPRALADV